MAFARPLALLMLAAIPAAAEEWPALVIGDAAQSAPVAEALKDAGFGPVTVGQDLGADGALDGAPRALVYLTAPKDADLAPLLARLADSGTREAVLLVEDCADDAVPAGRIAAPAAPPGLSLYMAASAGPGGTCPEPPNRLTDRLTDIRAADSLQAALEGLWIGADALGPVRPALAPDRLVFPPVPQDALWALPVAEGAPEPSIIVGILRPTNVASAPPDTPRPEIPYDDVAARDALRAADPELFRALVEEGALDPPEEALVTALQTELQRAGCYTSRIDGQWGGGSRGAVDRFFAAAASTPPGREPSAALFRQILLDGPAECAAPAPAATAARRTTPSRPSRPATTAPRPQPQPAPQPTRPSGGLSGSTLGGVFR